MKHRRHLALVPALAAALVFPSAAVTRCFAADVAPLPLVLPLPTIKGTPDNLPTGPGIEPLTDKGPELPKVAKGVVNVAKGKPVTSSVRPLFGEIAFVTDGQKEAYDEQSVEFALYLYRISSADFSDCLLGVTNGILGCTRTATFDQSAAELDEFELIPA